MVTASFVLLKGALTLSSLGIRTQSLFSPPTEKLACYGGSHHDRFTNSKRGRKDHWSLFNGEWHPTFRNVWLILEPIGYYDTTGKALRHWFEHVIERLYFSSLWVC